MPRTATGESSLVRVVRVLESFTAEQPHLRVGEIARRANLPVSTTSRLVAQMQNAGLLERADDQEVRIGVHLWEIAARAAPTADLKEASGPVLGDLLAVVGHHAMVSVVDGSDVLCVERMSAPGAVVNYSRTATRFPFHSTAAGLVLLAHSPAAAQARALSAPLKPFTSKTAQTPAQARVSMEEVRRTGFALLRGHMHPAVASVAVPVRDAAGEVVAALSVVVPDDDHVASHVPVLLAAARSLSRALGRPSSPSR